MGRRADSLFRAIVIVSVTMWGIFVFGNAGPDWLLRLFYIPISLPLFYPLLFCGGRHGCDGGLWYWPTIFVLGVLMWWAFIEGARYYWRRRGRAV
jgi:hypothetical protein